MFTDINQPTPPEWWDPRPATVRHHRPGWRVLVFVLVVVGGSALIWSGRDLQTVMLTLAGIGLTAASVARWVADGTPLPSLAWLTRTTGTWPELVRPGSHRPDLTRTAFHRPGFGGPGFSRPGFSRPGGEA